MSLGQQKSVFVVLKLFKTGLKLLRKNHTIYIIYRIIGLCNCIICPENSALFAIFYRSLSEGLKSTYDLIKIKNQSRGESSLMESVLEDLECFNFF